MPNLPPRLLLKTTLLPSGAQLGCVSSAGSLVRRRSPDPSAFIKYISELPSELLTKAMWRPSGEKTGYTSQRRRKVRRLSGSAVSGATAKISKLPVRLSSLSLAKTISLPSGDQDGLMLV